jgi:hypothetical protein
MCLCDDAFRLVLALTMLSRLHEGGFLRPETSIRRIITSLADIARGALP